MGGLGVISTLRTTSIRVRNSLTHGNQIAIEARGPLNRGRRGRSNLSHRSIGVQELFRFQHILFVLSQGRFQMSILLEFTVERKDKKIQASVDPLHGVLK